MVWEKAAIGPTGDMNGMRGFEGWVLIVLVDG